MLHYLLLHLLNFVVSLVNLLGHRLHTPPRLLLVPLQVLDVFIRLLQRSLLFLDHLAAVGVLGMALLDLVFFEQNHC